MKTALKIFCSAFMVGTIACAAFVSAAADVIYIKGDANGDNTISIKDVTTVQRVIAQLQKDPNSVIARRASMTSSKKLTVNDATALQAYLAEFENIHNIGTQERYDPYELPLVPNN